MMYVYMSHSYYTNNFTFDIFVFIKYQRTDLFQHLPKGAEILSPALTAGTH